MALDADCRALADAAAERWGRIDALVNSAGTTQFVPMSDLGGVGRGLSARLRDQYNRTVSDGARRCAADEEDRRRDRQCLVGRGAGRDRQFLCLCGVKGRAEYADLGAGAQFGTEIRVNAVLPGMVEGRWIREGLGAEAYERVKAQFASDAALGRVSTPEQIADSIGWLIQGAVNVTGQLITIDAGLLLGAPPKVAR